MGESFWLRWNDFGNNFLGSVRQLREDDDFVDVSLVTSDSGNKVLEAHKVVLAACSNFFKQILRRQSRASNNPNPVIFLRGISHEDLAAVLEFMYHGEIKVSSEKLGSFLAVSEELQIKGLTNRKNAQVVSKSVNEVAKISRPAAGGGGGGPSKRTRRSAPTSVPSQVEKSKADLSAADEDETAAAAVVGDVDMMSSEEVVIKADPDETAGVESTDAELQQLQDGDKDSDDENEFGEPKKSTFDPMQFVRRLTDDETAKAECTICHSKFRGVLNAKVHAIRTHGPPEYYQCTFCAKVVRCSYNFRDHIMRAHGINGRRLVETYGKLVGEA